MIIVFKNNNDNNFTKSQIAICNKKYMECTDLNDLLLKKDNITDEYIYILKKNYGFIESFYFNLDEIDSIKENIVLGYNNINVENHFFYWFNLMFLKILYVNIKIIKIMTI